LFTYFGKEKYRKVSTDDRIRKLKNITELLHCPNITTHLFTTNTTDDSNIEEVSQSNNNIIGYVIILCPNYDICYYRFCRYSGICEKKRRNNQRRS
jgi:hypothetical protein